MRIPRAILLALLCFLYSATASAQVLVVEANGQAAGTYYLELTLSADGQLTARTIGNVLRLSTAPAPPTVPPTTPPTTPTAGLDSAIARAAYGGLSKVADPNREHQRLQLAILYRELREYIGREFTGPPWQRLATATKEARVALLGEQSEANWRPWVEAVAVEFAALEKLAGGQGLQADQLRGAYGQVAIGLEHHPDGQARALDPQVRQLIVRIVRLILEQLLAGQAAAGAA